MEHEYVILDDIEAAVSQLGELGKTIVGPAARSIRETVLLLAAFRRWKVIHHGAFVDWGEGQVDDSLLWLVLDPLFPVARAGPHAKSIRFTRAAGPQGWQLDSTLPTDVENLVRGAQVGVIDDVAFSGGTLRHAADLVTRSGGELFGFVVATSTGEARRMIARTVGAAEWVQFLAGDFAALHLRDVCPYLPFAGRRVQGKDPVKTDHGPVNVRVTPLAFRGGLWQVLASDRGVQRSVSSAKRALIQRFTDILGRPATVSDIPLLGAEVAIPLTSDNSVTAESQLIAL
jgi:hypothetical protein